MARSSTSFKKGHPGGPGRPKGSKNRVYLNVTADNCTTEDWKEIVKKAVEDAKKGNHQARDWLSSILIGKDPVAVVEMLDELREQLEHLELVNGMATNGQATHRTNPGFGHSAN